MSSTNPDSWFSWYWGKEDRIEDEIIPLESLFRKEKVSRILDLGCGTGRHTLFFARKGFTVSGFDRSEAAIQRARKLFKDAGLSAHLRVWNMITTPYPYDSLRFDAVLAFRTIHHALIIQIRKIIAEIVRITRYGGYLYLSSPTYEKVLELRREGFEYEEVEPGTFIPHGGEEEGILHHYFKKDELLALLHEFEIDQISIKQEHYSVIAWRR